MWFAVIPLIIVPVLAISLFGEHSVCENCRGNRGFGCRSANKQEENEHDER